jgi:hypothetical protein
MGVFELRGRALITVILAVAGIDFLLVGVSNFNFTCFSEAIINVFATV